MAINLTCGRCGREFAASAQSARWLCDDCDGTTARRAAEEARWAGLTADQKADELRRLLLAHMRESQWDGRIG